MQVKLCNEKKILICSKGKNKFSLCNKLILSTIGNQRFPVYSLASSKLQIVESAECNWLRILCTYVLLSKNDRAIGLALRSLSLKWQKIDFVKRNIENEKLNKEINLV